MTLDNVAKMMVQNDCWAGIISQADLARTAPEHEVAELLCEVSKEHRSAWR